jgi:hypothetical protein
LFPYVCRLANATLVEADLESAIGELKAGHDGEIEVAGPDLAHSLTELGRYVPA